MKMLAALAFTLVLGHVASGDLSFWSKLSRKVEDVVSSNEKYPFDYLIYTQQWPNTACYVYSNSTSECRLPPKKNPFWTVHGIWPSNYTSYGPNTCDPKKVFDIEKLASIEKKLEKRWADIKTYESYETFWSHEWIKHGTCAMQLKPLKTELLYFKQGLQWNQKYNMMNILNALDVVPDSQKGYNMTIVWQGLKQQLGTSPEIACAYDKTTKQHFIQEIRLCFSKQLELVDCYGTMQQLLGQCPETKSLFIYPATVPPKSLQDEHAEDEE